MKKTLLALSLLFALTACGGENSAKAPAPEASAAQPQASAPVQSAIATMDTDWATYRQQANNLLKDKRTGISIPDTAEPSDNGDGSHKLYQQLADGLVLSVITDATSKLSEVRIIWQPENNPKQSQQLSVAAVSLLAATNADDRKLFDDATYQMAQAIESHNAKSGGASSGLQKFTRFDIDYKIAVTNQPSVLLTANAK